MPALLLRGSARTARAIRIEQTIAFEQTIPFNMATLQRTLSYAEFEMMPLKK